MKAAILEQINFPLVVDNVELTDLKVGQVLVKVLVSGLCGAQLQEIAGLKGNSKFVPHLLGHEGCGIVEEVGPGVSRVKKGDKVIMHWRKGEGIESPFPSYQYKNKIISSGKVTTLSQFSIASENRLTAVSRETPETLCALLGCGLSTALGVVNYDANIKFGETVLVIGCGGVGLNVILGAKLAGAGSIYGFDRTEEKTIFINNFKGIPVFNFSDIKEKIDCIIDTTGLLDVVSESLPLLSSRGRVILVSQPKENNALVIKNPSNLFSVSGQTIKTTQGGGVNPTEDFLRYINLYKYNSLPFEKLITNVFDLDNINNAIETLRSGKAGRILIKIS
jgi:Zn-dependent alcohol dehydrogenase